MKELNKIETINKIISDLNTDLCMVTIVQESETRDANIFSLKVQIKAMENYLELAVNNH